MGGSTVYELKYHEQLNINIINYVLLLFCLELCFATLNYASA